MGLDLSKFYTVTQKDMETDPEAVLEKASSGISPILIKADNGHDVLLFDWDDYLEQFGCLYTNEELEAIQAACKTLGEQGGQHGNDDIEMCIEDIACKGCRDFNPHGDCIAEELCPECGSELVCMCRIYAYSSFAGREERILHCKTCLSDWLRVDGNKELERKFWG